MSETRDHWSECGQIFFHYGKGYGLTNNLHSICLGGEEDIMKVLETGTILDNPFTQKQRQVLNASYRKIKKAFRLYEKLFLI